MLTESPHGSARNPYYTALPGCSEAAPSRKLDLGSGGAPIEQERQIQDNLRLFQDQASHIADPEAAG